jgi:hypothetical protein
MGNLINRAMYHPLVALPTVYVMNLMFCVDYSLAGALLALASESICQIVRLINNRYRRGEGVAS